MSKQNTRATIDANIKQNGQQLITGQVLNATLNAMVTDYAEQAALDGLKEKVDALALGAFYGYFPDSDSLPTDVTTPGYAYVGTDNPYEIWNFNGESWSDSGTSIDQNDADEEDITRNSDGKLQFKDRDTSDGMGYVILRKDKSFAEQVTEENTIYEIRYDFDLNGAKYVLPKNITLKFIGGKLANGTIYGRNTRIDAEACQIFETSVTVGDTWIIDTAYIQWYGASGNGTDETYKVQKMLDFIKVVHCELYINNITLLVKRVAMTNGHNVAIKCDGVIKRVEGQDLSNNIPETLNFYNCSNIKIERINLDGNAFAYQEEGSLMTAKKATGHCMQLQSCTDVTLGYIHVKNPLADGVKITGDCQKITCKSLIAEADSDSGREALLITKGKHIVFDYIYSNNVGVKNEPGGIDLESVLEGDDMENIVIKNAYIVTGGRTGIGLASQQGIQCEKKNIYIKGYVKMTTSSDYYVGTTYKGNNIELDIEYDNLTDNNGFLIGGDLENSKLNIKMRNAKTGMNVSGNLKNVDIRLSLENISQEGIRIFNTRTFENVNIHVDAVNSHYAVFAAPGSSTINGNLIIDGTISNIDSIPFAIDAAINGTLKIQNIDLSAFDRPFRGTTNDYNNIIISNCNGVTNTVKKPTNNFYPANTVVYSQSPLTTNCIGWYCIKGGNDSITPIFIPFGEFTSAFKTTGDIDVVLPEVASSNTYVVNLPYIIPSGTNTIVKIKNPSRTVYLTAKFTDGTRTVDAWGGPWNKTKDSNLYTTEKDLSQISFYYYYGGTVTIEVLSFPQ